MKIDHIAIWVKDLELSKQFYMQYFNLRANKLYLNEAKGFSSYFLSFIDGARLELMHNKHINSQATDLQFGFAHIAFSVGSICQVDELTEALRNDGYRIVGEPRTTGDGYYESVIADPDGNFVEITE